MPGTLPGIMGKFQVPWKQRASRIRSLSLWILADDKGAGKYTHASMGARQTIKMGCRGSAEVAT